MENEKTKFCPAMWLSGFFALGAVVHLVRFLFQISLTVGGHEIPLTVSFVLGLVLGAFSLALGIAGLKRPCEKNQKMGTCCKH